VGGGGIAGFYWVVLYMCQRLSSLGTHIVSGRIPKNREEKAQGIPMIEYAKGERKRKV